MRSGRHAAIEGSIPTPLHGLGSHLQRLADDPAAGLYIYEGVVRPVPDAMAEIAPDEPPIFRTLQQEITCATTGVAQVIYFPRHRAG